MPSSILIVDDEPAARHGMIRALEKEGYALLEADSVASAREKIESRTPQVVVLDVRLASESGMDFLPEVVARNNPPVVIIVTAHGSERLAVEAVKRGAYDYLPKPFDVDELRIIVKNAVEAKSLREENSLFRNKLADRAAFGELIGSSPAMLKVYSLIEKVAPTDAAIFITGESGTGKEVVANEIHRRSRVAGGAFVAVNCAALPEELIESELFGHEKGAFTSAATRRIGKFEAAKGGTIFLDEIGDMSQVTQAKVLRVLEQKTFERLGGNETFTTDARLISATNRNLEREISEGRFRADLYYRLRVVNINLPPLRERPSDIPALAQSFWDRYRLAYRHSTGAIPGTIAKTLLEHDWPGNVRQLRNYLERAAVLYDETDLNRPLDLALDPSFNKTPEVEKTLEGDSINISANQTLKAAKREFERKFISAVLERFSGNITQASSFLGMHRQSLQQKIKELGLSKKFVQVDQ